MIKKAFFSLLVIINIFILSGCWSRQEPRDIGIGTSFIYDIDEEGVHKIIVEVYDPSINTVDAPVQKANYLVLAEGESFSNALREVTETFEHRIEGTHNRARFFTERYAEKGISDAMEFISRDPIANERPYMFIVKNEDPMVLHEAQFGTAKLLGLYIDEMASVRSANSPYSRFVTTLDFIKDFYLQGKQPVMGVVEVIENPVSLEEREEEGATGPPTKYNIIFEGLAVFKGTKMLGYLDKNQTSGYNYVTDNISSPYTVFNIGSDSVTVFVDNSNTSINASMDMATGKVKVDVTIKQKLRLRENKTDYNPAKAKEIKIMEQHYNKYLAEEIKGAIESVQSKYNSDIF